MVSAVGYGSECLLACKMQWSTSTSWRLHITVLFTSGTDDRAVLVHTSQWWLTCSFLS